MDNYTLIAATNIILFINVFFTFLISGNSEDSGLKEWRYSSVFLSSGFIFILMQNVMNPLISFCIANYLIMLGFFYQVSATVTVEFRKNIINSYFVPVISFFYWVLFLYFTFIQFHTPIRIIVISSFFVIFYIYGSIHLGRGFKAKLPDQIYIKELFFLFIFSAVFYVSRIIVTIDGMGAVRSLYEKNIPTTITFIYVIIFNLIYNLGMFNSFLRNRNAQIISEKNKLTYLFDFLNDTARHLDIDELCESIEDVLRKSLGVGTAGIYLLDEKKENLKMFYVFNELDLSLDSVKTLKIGEGSAGKSIEKDKVVELDMDSYPIKEVADEYRSKGVVRLISAPLKTADGVIGAITVAYSNNKNEVLDEYFFYYLGEQIGLVLHNAFLYKQVNLLANTDPLTGLYNRRKMQELFNLEIKRTLRSNAVFSVAMIDLDFFKKINDNFGHDCGDNVLETAAALFNSECRETDYICRWGGEEFLILFIDTDLSSASEVAERIKKKFEQSEISCINSYNFTLSIGITDFKSDKSMEEIIKRADNALYLAKKNGRNRIEIL